MLWLRAVASPLRVSKNLILPLFLRLRPPKTLIPFSFHRLASSTSFLFLKTVVGESLAIFIFSGQIPQGPRSGKDNPGRSWISCNHRRCFFFKSSLGDPNKSKMFSWSVISSKGLIRYFLHFTKASRIAKISKSVGSNSSRTLSHFSNKRLPLHIFHLPFRA